MLLRDIINPIAKYHDRENKIKQVKIKKVTISIDNKIFTVNGIVNDYQTLIKFINPKTIDLTDEILIDCQCKSFEYEFAFANRKDLIFPEKYLNRAPREKNVHRLPGVCKHLYALGRYVFQNKNKFLQQLKGELL